MREILFRGKSVDTGKWVFGSFIPDDREMVNGYEETGDDGYIKPSGRTREERLMVEVGRETVGQYTGLKDKNGKKIFEGDIVRGRAYSMEFRGYIIWIDEIGSFGLRTGHDIAAQNCTILDRANRGMNDEFSAEIIGNIYDNPELLESKVARK